MKIGIFDSGLGGLLILKNIRELMPEYDYVFFGDQAFVPYGNKTKEELLERAKIIFKYLYEKEDCKFILLACNTTSTNIFTDLKDWVKENFPGREVWSMVRPTVEAVKENKDIVFFGTHLTISSHVYKEEMQKLNKENIIEIEMPQLATLIEEGKPTLNYIQSLNSLDQAVEYEGVLVCTHYGIAINEFTTAYPQVKNWICQEDIIPIYIQNFFNARPDKIEDLSKNRTLEILVSKENINFTKFTKEWFREAQAPKIINI